MARYSKTTRGTRNLDHSRVAGGGVMSHAEIERRLTEGSSDYVGAAGGTRYDFIVTGPLFIADEVTPSFLLPSTTAVKRVWMTVGRMPQGSSKPNSEVRVEVVYDGNLLATLIIDQDSADFKSLEIDGAALGQIAKDKYIDINITHVGDIVPGSDMKVYIEV